MVQESKTARVKGVCQKDMGQIEGTPSGQVLDNLSSQININGNEHRIKEISMNPLWYKYIIE